MMRNVLGNETLAVLLTDPKTGAPQGYGTMRQGGRGKWDLVVHDLDGDMIGIGRVEMDKWNDKEGEWS
jgi:hypothetical protein